MNLERLRILVIDDDENVASTVALLLSRDHDVTTTTDARSGLELASSGSFDIVLCDLLMPRLSGNELFQRLKTTSPGLEERVVFMTGGATNLKAQEFLDSGSVRMIEKPFSLRELREMIQTLRDTALKRRSAEK